MDNNVLKELLEMLSTRMCNMVNILLSGNITKGTFNSESSLCKVGSNLSKEESCLCKRRAAESDLYAEEDDLGESREEEPDPSATELGPRRENTRPNVW